MPLVRFATIVHGFVVRQLEIDTHGLGIKLNRSSITVVVGFFVWVILELGGFVQLETIRTCLW